MLLPSKLGIISERGKGRQMQLHHFRFGDNYMQCLSQGLGRL